MGRRTPARFGNATLAQHRRSDDPTHQQRHHHTAGWLTECTCLDLSNNELGPAIPGSYGGLLKCKRIWLNDNLILEPVPSTMVGTTSIVHRA